MSERELENVMYGFVNGDIDVLVSTTIIETGLDISNVNTMIIHDSGQIWTFPALSAARQNRTVQPHGLRIFDVPKEYDAEGDCREETGCNP